MTKDEQYMQRCLELAAGGLGHVAPNPLVGCLVVHNDAVIGEGWHKEFGGPHAEVNAIASVEKKGLLKESTLYVNLEPCNHTGKTPPCTQLILEHGIKKVVICNTDPNPLVNGSGIAALKAAGCDVRSGLLEGAGRELNRRFFTWHEKKRPYLILKWAQSADGFIDNRRYGNKDKPAQISNSESRKLLHRWRSEEQAIMVGTNTALMDNPRLTARDWPGLNPLRVVVDRRLSIPAGFHLFDKSTPTLVFTEGDRGNENNLEYVKIGFEGNVLGQVLEELYRRNIQSLIVEGGEVLLSRFIGSGLWDEARVFIGASSLQEGLKAPRFPYSAAQQQDIAGDRLLIYRNRQGEVIKNP